MSKQMFVDASSLEEAQQQAEALRPGGFKVLSTYDASDYVLAGSGHYESEAEALKALKGCVPAEAVGTRLDYFVGDQPHELWIDAHSSKEAKALAQAKVGKDEEIYLVELRHQGSAGFLGLGRKPNRYRTWARERSRYTLYYTKEQKFCADLVPMSVTDAVRSQQVGDFDAVMAADAPFDDQEDGYTPLMWAAVLGEVYMLRALIDKGAWLNSHTEWGATALTMAAQKGHTAAVELLLSRGAFVDARESDGYTALTRAAMEGHAEIVKLLLANGAYTDFTTKHGLTALDLARERGHTRIVEMLEGR